MSSFKRVDFYFHLKAFSMAPFERLTLLGMGWGTFLLRTKEESRACKWQTFPGFGELNERKCFFSEGDLGLEASDQPSLFRIPFSAASQGENAM